MSKSILVIDTPRDCIECPCHYADEKMIFCNKENKKVYQTDYLNGTFIPYWCPLQDLEDKKDCDYIDAYCNGWNDCIDEVLKGGYIK